MLYMKKGKRMNHCVPDFAMEDDFVLPTSSTLARPKKSTMQEDEIMELLWQNGQVVMQSQTQRSSLKKQFPPSKYEDAVLRATQPTVAREIQSQPQHHQHHLFMQEDEMASWLHYPLNDANFDQDFCNDLLYPPSATDADAACVASTATTSTTITNTASLPFRGVMQQYPEVRPLPEASVAARPPIHPGRKAEVAQNFSHFSRHPQRATTPAATESGPSNSKSVVRELTVVDSCVTPSTDVGVGRSMVGGSSGDHTCGTMSGDAVAASVSGVGAGSSAKEVMMITTTCDTTVTSSPGCSSASAEPRPHPPLPPQKPIVEDRKRKGKEEDVERHSEDAEFESAEPKKQVCGSSSKKRSRAAEVHNQSERRRRDRINEKMRALQELIPRCNKSDKASMLDEAIEYLKSLQLQVQMMSMGCSMVPMVFPGIQQYMPPMGMAMGIGMGMEMGLNRPMMPFPNVLAGAPSSTPAAAAHLCPRFPMPTFHMPPVPAPDPSRVQAANQPDSTLLTSLGTQNPNPPRVPNFTDPYQQYLGLHQMQAAPNQNPPMAQPVASKPSTSRGPENLDNRQSGT